MNSLQTGALEGFAMWISFRRPLNRAFFRTLAFHRSPQEFKGDPLNDSVGQGAKRPAKFLDTSSRSGDGDQQPRWSQGNEISESGQIRRQNFAGFHERNHRHDGLEGQRRSSEGLGRASRYSQSRERDSPGTEAHFVGEKESIGERRGIERTPERRLDGSGSRRQPDVAPRSRDSGEQHYGYSFRNSNSEVGEFRKIDTGSSRGRSDRHDFVERERRRLDSRSSESYRGRSSVDTDSRQMGSQVTEESGARAPAYPRRQEGEKKWQFAVRKKQQLAGWSRGQTRKSTQKFVDDEDLGDEPLGDEWRQKKMAWLCKEIPGLKPRGLVTILNEQRKWINATDVKYIVQHLLRIGQFLRAHRVLKWEMQQPWYEYNFELNTAVANSLGENNKLSRTRDLYDLMIQNRKVPELSTYVLLINCYIADGTNEALQKAGSLFNQMIQMGGYEPPPTLRYKLFNALLQKNFTHLDQADAVFGGIKNSGLAVSEEMYNSLILLHGTNGNQERVDFLIEEMKKTGLKVGEEVYAAIIRACVKDGNIMKGEQAFTDLKSVWEKQIPSVYASLIKMYGDAGLPGKALESFEEIRLSGISLSINIYEPIIAVLAAAGKRQQAEKLLKEAQERGLPSMQGCYNAVMGLYSKSGLIHELETTFQDMQSAGCKPNAASFNAVLEGYVKCGFLEKAEAVFQGMKIEGRIGPNQRTFEIMIKAYGDAGNSEKLKEMFHELAGRKMAVPHGAAEVLEKAVSPKRLDALKNSNLKLNRNQRELLAGVLLGGARVESHDKNRTYEIHFGLDPDSEGQSILIKHLYEQFSDWSKEAPREQPMSDIKDPLKSKTLLTFQTVSHGAFRFFAHQYRPDRKAKIPRLIHRWLSPQALAYWYMYGGYKCPQTGGIILDASPYSGKELMLVVDALKARTIDCESKRQSKEGLVLRVTGKSATWLWKLMEPFIIPGLKVSLKPEDRSVCEPS